MIKIARVIPDFDYPSPVGPHKFAHILSNELYDLGFDTTIYTLKSKRQTNKYHSKYQVIVCDGLLSLGKKLLDNDFDIVHVHGYRVPSSDVASLIARLKHKPVVVTPHGSVLGYRYLSHSMLNNILHVSYDIITNKYVLQTSAAIIATSKSEASQLLLFGIPKNKIRIIYPAEDIMKVKQQRKLTEFPRRIIFVGRINPIMQLDILIRAFSIVLKKVDAELWIVGPIGEYQVTDRFKKKEKYSEYLRRLSVDLQVSSRVHFSGFLTGQALLDTYSSSHLFVFLCPFGNYGRTLVEAAAFGLPIVCGRVGIATELVGNNDSGILVDEINDINVATAIEYILTDPKEYERMSRNALNNVTKFLDVKRMVKEHAQLYTEVLTAQYKTKSRF